MDKINLSAIINLIESNWYEFIEYADNEEDAEETLNALKEEAGIVS